MVFTCEKNDMSNQNREQYFFTCEKNDTSKLQGRPRACRASVSRGQTPPGVQEICDGNYAR